MSVGDRSVDAAELRSTLCAVCEVEGGADQLYGPNLSLEAFTPAAFSARRLPDRVHYRIVRCRRCGLVRSDPVADQELMAGLYRASTFDYGDELDSLRVTYGKALQQIGAYAPSRHGLLDIGCGNGFVLQLALEPGWDGVRGGEPSADAGAE